MSLGFNMKTKIQVVRCEGLNCDGEGVGCYIMINNEQYGDVTSLLVSSNQNNVYEAFKGNCLEIPKKGELKILLKSISSCLLPFQSS